jgi:F420-non-reducing hydrogenase iron-sulfur subunit
MSDYEPKVLAFLCHWCSYGAADAAGASRKIHPANVKIVRVMCSGQVDPQLVLKAFAQGADGVMVLGCHLGDCHYQEGNVQALKRFALLERTLGQLGIHPDRFMLEWVSKGEADKFVAVTEQMVARVRRLGALSATASPAERPTAP